MHAVKKIGFWFALVAMISTQAVYAHHSSNCSSHHHSKKHCHHQNNPDSRLAKISLQRYLSDLNVVILSLSLQTPNFSSIFNAYFADIENATQTLQNALAALGAENQAAGVAFQFDAYALLLNNPETGLANFTDQANNIADALSALSPSLDPTIVRKFVINLNNAVVGNMLNVGLFGGSIIYPFAIENNNIAHQVGNDLLNYIIKILTMQNSPHSEEQITH